MTLDTLRPPRGRDEAFWEWRQRPPRPVTFHPLTRLSEDAEQLHLAHPFVKRILDRFLAQGFGAHDLTRVTAVLAPDESVIRVVAYARLTLFGAGAARLHDQLVPIAAAWAGDASDVQPYKDRATSVVTKPKTERLLAENLAKAPNATIGKRIQSSADALFRSLWPHLEAEADALAVEARLGLAQRARRESDELRALLDRQRTAIDKAEIRLRQADLFNIQDKEQKRQVELDPQTPRPSSDRAASELTSEPAAIEALYDVRMSRLTPVGCRCLAGDDDVKDRDVLFHEKWPGLAPNRRPGLERASSSPMRRSRLRSPLSFRRLSPRTDTTGAPGIRSVERFFREFLGYDQKGMLVPRAELPAELSFYAAEGGQELRPSFALGRGPFASDDPFAAFEAKAAAPAEPVVEAKPWFALIWDLTEYGDAIDLDAPESATGPWRYAPTAKLERLLRHVGVPVGFLFNGRELRLVYAPPEESPAYLSPSVSSTWFDLTDARFWRRFLLDLLPPPRTARLHRVGRAILEGLLSKSRLRQADVTGEPLKAGLRGGRDSGWSPAPPPPPEAAASRDISGERLDWLRAALEEEGDHLYEGILSVVLRLVFLLYAEDQSLLPVEHPIFAEHLSLFGLYARLSHDAGAHPESMHHRFGAYGQLLSLFRTVFFGVKHGSLDLPRAPRASVRSQRIPVSSRAACPHGRLLRSWTPRRALRRFLRASTTGPSTECSTASSSSRGSGSATGRSTSSKSEASTSRSWVTTCSASRAPACGSENPASGWRATPSAA